MLMRTEDVTLIGATRLRRSDKAPKQARAAVAWWLATGPPVLPDAQQVVSELVTNACTRVEGGVDREWVAVSLSLGPDFIRIEVTDPGAFASEPHIPDYPPLEVESGRGIRIVMALSENNWGTFIKSSGHRVVWADLKIPSP
ncbi:ATP-binding protein [Nonomuraea sp. NPDC049269]|uniref:ATP-binding protein n=1 Tax=Nonomuraea sp. NPDC049269 TaxID=3364349 RepID=UPI0037100294